MSFIESKLISLCMKRNGFAYPTEREQSAAPDNSEFGLSVSQAKKDGYTSVSGILALNADGNEGVKPSEASDPAYGLALFGDRDAPSVTIDDPVAFGTLSMLNSGCLGEVKTALYGSVEDALLYSTVGPNFMYRLATEIKDDPEYVQLNAAWAGCLAAAGWTGLDSPGAAISRARQLAGGQLFKLATDEPRRIAIADATCQAQTDYAATRRELEDRYITALLANLAEPVEQVTQIEVKALAHADALLAGQDGDFTHGVGVAAAG